MPDVSHHLLRLLAAVAPGTTVADATGSDACADALARLGLDVRREPLPDACAPWAVVAGRAAPALPGAMAEAARVLTPGGWAWAEVAAADASALADAARAAGLLEAEEPAPDEARGTVHAVFRRPGGIG